jgi:hypothetical protein
MQPPPDLEAADFEQIESAVMRTERGRWFLDEFARRRRSEETKRILTAIDRLETRSAEAEAAETRARLEWERSASVLRELANLLREIRATGDARAPPPRPARISAATTPDNPAGELEARLAALAKLDVSDVEKLNPFG